MHDERGQVPRSSLGETIDDLLVALGTATPQRPLSQERVEELKALLGQQRQRQDELTSLYSVVRSLTVLQDTDDALAAIVRNAHEVINSDVTYLSIIDEEQGALVLRASEGRVPDKLTGARVPVSCGVAAEVIATRRPFAVLDYLNAPELSHDRAFDDIFREAGLVSLLGVPLAIGASVRGVLYAASSHRHSFSAGEIALLSALADHAAVALENSRLYEERKRALTGLSAAYDTIEQQLDATRRSLAVHDALTRTVLSGGGASDVADLLCHFAACDVMILDRDDRPIVVRAGRGIFAADSRGAGSPVTAAIAAAVIQSRRTSRSVSFDDAGSHGTVVTIAAGTIFFGSLVVTTPESDAELFTATIEQAAHIVALLTLWQERVTEAEARVRGEMLAELLTSPSEISDDQLARASARGVDLHALNTIAVIRAQTAQPTTRARELRRISREMNGLSGEHLGWLVLLVQSDDCGELVTTVHRQLSSVSSAPSVVCASSVDPDSEPLGRAFALATRCSDLLDALGVVDRAATTDELALYASVFDPDRAEQLGGFLERVLGPVNDYDQRGRRTDLLGTLRAYFACSGNLARTARHLHIHMNTLLKRLERVSQVLGEEWQQPERGLELHLAIRLHDLANAAGS